MTKYFISLGFIFLSLTSFADERIAIDAEFFNQTIQSQFGNDLWVEVPVLTDVTGFDLDIFETDLVEIISNGETEHETRALAANVKLDEETELLDCRPKNTLFFCYRAKIGKRVDLIQFSDYFHPTSEVIIDKEKNKLISVPLISRTPINVTKIDYNLHVAQTFDKPRAYRFTSQQSAFLVKSNEHFRVINPAQQNCLAEQIEAVATLKQDPIFMAISDELHVMGIGSNLPSVQFQISLVDRSDEYPGMQNAVALTARSSGKLEGGLVTKINAVMVVNKTCLPVKSSQLMDTFVLNEDVKKAFDRVKSRNQIHGLFPTHH